MNTPLSGAVALAQGHENPGGKVNPAQNIHDRGPGFCGADRRGLRSRS